MLQKVKLRFFANKSISPRSRLRGLLTPRQTEPELRNRELVMLVLLVGSVVITSLLLVLLLISYFGLGNTFVGPRIIVAVIAFGLAAGAYLLVRGHRYRRAAVLLISLYSLFAVLSIWQWGVNVPFGVLIMSVLITLSGILLSARYSLYTAAACGLVLIGTQTAATAGWHQPNEDWLLEPSNFGHVLGYCCVFGILALVSWLFGRQMERSLRKARQAEMDLLAEKKLLSVRLKERTQKLKAAQFKEMQQLYRFAELGQLSTALLHDLSNHLSVLTLDIEDLERRRHSQAIERAKQSMVYLDAMVEQVRQQLREDTTLRNFNCLHTIQSVVENLKPRANEWRVRLEVQQKGRRQQLDCYGDKTRFAQIITVVTSNAAEAANQANNEQAKRVLLTIIASKQAITIRVEDWGPGVPAEKRSSLFQPFHSTKKNGMGIGLFIARQMLATHFKGTIKLTQARQPTTFTITIPTRTSHEKTTATKQRTISGSSQKSSSD